MVGVLSGEEAAGGAEDGQNPRLIHFRKKGFTKRRISSFATPSLLVRCTGGLDTFRLDTIWCREGIYHIPGRAASGKLRGAVFGQG